MRHHTAPTSPERGQGSPGLPAGQSLRFQSRGSEPLVRPHPALPSAAAAEGTAPGTGGGSGHAAHSCSHGGSARPASTARRLLPPARPASSGQATFSAVCTKAPLCWHGDLGRALVYANRGSLAVPAWPVLRSPPRPSPRRLPLRHRGSAENASRAAAAQARPRHTIISGVFLKPAGALSTMSNWLSFLFPKVRTFYLRLCPF